MIVFKRRLHRYNRLWGIAEKSVSLREDRSTPLDFSRPASNAD